MAEKVQNNLEKLEIRKRAITVIIKNNDNKTVPNKRNQRIRQEMKIDKINTANKWIGIIRVIHA